MLSILRKFREFLNPSEDQSPHPSLLLDKDGRLVSRELAATFTTLLVDVALSDESLQENEIAEIMSILRNELAISEQQAQEAVSVALEKDHDVQTDIRKVSSLGVNLSDEQREFLLILILKVAHADERLSKAESEIIDRTAHVLRLSEEQIESARQRSIRG